VQTICEKILIIAKGTLIAYDEPEKLENQLMAPNEILFTTDADEEETREILADVADELISRFPEDLKKSEKQGEEDAGCDRALEESAPEADESVAAGVPETAGVSAAADVSETADVSASAGVPETADRSVLGGGILYDISLEEKDGSLTGVRLKTKHDNIYDVSRAISFAFAGKQKALFEMSLKKANLEDIFIELTKEDEQP
jgi:ABC-type multidrug transport system ATPase subunit